MQVLICDLDDGSDVVHVVTADLSMSTRPIPQVLKQVIMSAVLDGQSEREYGGRFVVLSLEFTVTDPLKQITCY